MTSLPFGPLGAAAWEQWRLLRRETGGESEREMEGEGGERERGSPSRIVYQTLHVVIFDVLS